MIKILLVDDQNLVREGIKALLQLTPQMSVIAEACDGDEALTALEQYSPDIMLLDLRMPKRDGLSVLEAMQQKNINVPTLILTTFDEHDLVLNCLKLGAMGYLKKDVSLNDLVCAIESLAKGIPWVKPAQSVTLTKNKAHISYTDTHPSCELTAIETQVLNLVAAGYSNHEIADALHKSVGTVRNQVSCILQKLGVRDRTRAVLKAIELGFI